MKKQIQKKWYIYILKTEKNTLYTGITTDIKRRIHEHQYSKKGAKYFRSTKPIGLVFLKTKKNRSEASILEAKIKKMSRAQKDKLIRKKILKLLF